MSDWQPGDLALCVAHGPDAADWAEGDGGPTLGSVHTVERAEWFAADYWNPAGVYLSFAEFPDSDFNALGFRKIKPLSDTEREEALRDLKAPVREVAA